MDIQKFTQKSIEAIQKAPKFSNRAREQSNWPRAFAICIAYWR